MSNDQKPPAAPDGADPSMEEILASIRRILNEEDAPITPPAPEEAETNNDDVLILDQSMMVPMAGPAEHPSSEAEPAPARLEAPASEPRAPEPPAPEPYAPAPERRVATEPPTPADFLDHSASELVAPEAAAAAASSLGSLMRTLTAGRATHVYAGGPTLEDLVRAELRPLLKEWLDAHLPPMVERLVRAEIERVVGRAGT